MWFPVVAFPPDGSGISPEMELVEMNNNDIITTSGFDNNNLMDEYFGNDKDGYNFSDFY